MDYHSLSIFPMQTAALSPLFPARTFLDEISGIILDPSSSMPLHSQLTSALRGLILSGKWTEQRLPTEGELSNLFNISVSTVRQALAPLATEKLIERQRSRGSFVKRMGKDRTLKYLTVIKPNYPSVGLNYHMDIIHRQAETHGVEIKTVNLSKGDDWKELNDHIEFVPEEGGVLLLQTSMISTVSLYHLLTERGYRTVNLGDPVPDYPGTFITTNYRSAVHLGLRTLRELGHERILFLVSEPEEFNEVIGRFKVFEEVAAKFQMSEARVYHCGIHAWENPRLAAIEAMPYIWKAKDRPTAIFAVSDGAAAGVYQWLETNNLVAPRDISLLSFDGLRFTDTDPVISTLVSPIEQIVDEMFRLLKFPTMVPRHIFLDPTLHFGSTIGAPV